MKGVRHIGILRRNKEEEEKKIENKSRTETRLEKLWLAAARAENDENISRWPDGRGAISWATREGLTPAMAES